MDAHQGQDTESDDTCHDGGHQEGHVGAQQAHSIHVTVLAGNPHDSDDALRETADRLAQGRGNNPPARAGHRVQGPAHDHLDDRRANTHEEHGLDVLVGEEDALAHEDHARGGDAGHQRSQDEGVGCHSLGIPALGGHRDLHHGHRAGHEHGRGHEGQRRDCADAQMVAVGHRTVVAVGDGTGHAREDCGRQGHGDERLGDHEDHERRRISEDADDAALGAVAADEAVGHGSQVVGRQDADLRDAEGRERPASHARHRAEGSAAEVEVQLERDARATHRPQQTQGLADDAKGRRASQNPELG